MTCAFILMSCKLEKTQFVVFITRNTCLVCAWRWIWILCLSRCVLYNCSIYRIYRVWFYHCFILLFLTLMPWTLTAVWYFCVIFYYICVLWITDFVFSVTWLNYVKILSLSTVSRNTINWFAVVILCCIGFVCLVLCSSDRCNQDRKWMCVCVYAWYNETA